MRETIIANCEKKFLLKCLSEFRRLDGRAFDEFRPLDIKFGKDWGCCYVSLGRTRVLAQTSCEIQPPKSSRPSEGILNINVELNPLAAPHFEPGRQSDLSVQLNRLLEKCIKDSKAVDLESLCIKTSEKVWALRVDINVLNHEGNILDCASVALLASLAHFKRPDVTCDGEDFTIHTYQQRDPIPIVIHHYPITITYSIFNGGEFILADPDLLEEGVADAAITIGLNGYKELCGLHLGGNAELTPTIILSTVNKAYSRVKIIIDEIKNAIKEDNEKRQEKVEFDFNLIFDEIASEIDLQSCLDQWKEPKKTKKKKKKQKTVKMQIPAEGSAVHVPDTWEIDDSSENDEVMIVDVPAAAPVQVHDTDSEEDDVVVLNSEEFTTM